MIKGFSDPLLSKIADVISANTGLFFPKERWNDLCRGLIHAASGLGFDDADACMEWLASSSSLTRQEIQVLASCLTVGETYFFRDSKTFDVIREYVIPEIRRQGSRNLRIWSVGCATGEEAYSIAILLNECIPDIHEWRCTILATDINPEYLQKAVDGVYGMWSFRSVSPWIRQKYFDKNQEGRYVLQPRIKKMVTFAYINLAEEEFPSSMNNTNSMDVILCRNVLMYFSENQARKTVAALYRSLNEGGWFVGSPVEYSTTLFGQFVKKRFYDVILYRKDSGVSGFSLDEAAFSGYRGSLPLGEQRSSTLLPDFCRDENGAASSCGLVQDIAPVAIVEAGEPAGPDTFSTLCKEALILYEGGRYLDVIRKLEPAVSDKRNDASAMLLIARSYANEGNLAEALHWCERGIVLEKLNPSYHYLHAIIMRESGRIEDALRSLNRTLYLDSRFVLAYLALGNLEQFRGHFREAQHYFKTALALLHDYECNECLPESDGVTAGQLSKIIENVLQSKLGSIRT